MARIAVSHFLTASLLMIGLVSASTAFSADTKAKTKNSRAINSVHSPLNPQLERDVLQMVDEHLPELKTLIDQLRNKAPQQYDSAIRNLAKSSRRLQSAKKRGEEFFELEVHVVQAQSAVNLLIAKLKVRDNKADRKALHQATERFEKAEIARATHDLAFMKSRLEKLQEQYNEAAERLKHKESQMEQTIDRDYQLFLKKSGRKP